MGTFVIGDYPLCALTSPPSLRTIGSTYSLSRIYLPVDHNFTTCTLGRWKIGHGFPFLFMYLKNAIILPISPPFSKYNLCSATKLLLGLSLQPQLTPHQPHLLEFALVSLNLLKTCYSNLVVVPIWFWPMQSNGFSEYILSIGIEPPSVEHTCLVTLCGSQIHSRIWWHLLL